jgi:hypothetical protein
MRRLSGALCALGIAAVAIVATERVVGASNCDDLTGGGFIYVNGAKVTFGVGGGCKNGSGTGTPPAPYWGHLEYQDHSTGLDVHWTSITAYQDWDNNGDDGHGQPVGKRLICGAARTNDPAHPNVYFAVVAADHGEPGTADTLEVLLTDTSATYPYYDTGVQTLGGGDAGGGNLQLHKPNPSTTSGVFGGSCAALAFEGF